MINILHCSSTERRGIDRNITGSDTICTVMTDASGGSGGGQRRSISCIVEIDAPRKHVVCLLKPVVGRLMMREDGGRHNMKVQVFSYTVQRFYENRVK